MGLWLKGLIAAAIGGAANALGTILYTGVTAIDWNLVATTAATGAFVAVVMYLKQSPVPLDEERASIPKPGHFAKPRNPNED